eukprot:5810573-Pyramimonas_sp.AAC.1
MTGDVIKCMLDQSSAASPGRLQFERRSRLATTDKFSGNGRAERGIIADRGDKWKSIRLDCRMHINATVHVSVFKIVDVTITNMTHLAKSLRLGGELPRFRKFLKRWILKPGNIEFRVGSPPADAAQWKANAARVFLGGKAAVKRLSVLNCFANGDWRNHRCIEHYSRVPFDSPGSKLKRSKEIAEGLAFGLASCQPFVYVKSRWDGCDQAADDIAILEIVHGLLANVYPDYVASFRKAEQRKQAGGSGAAAGADDD